MNVLHALVVLVGLIVAPTGAAPARSRPAVTERTAAKRIARLPKLVTKLGARSPSPIAGSTMELHKGIALHTEALADHKLSLSARQPVDGPAFLVAVDATVVPVAAAGYPARGVHVRAGGYVVASTTREWVGTHDLLVECRGALPAKLRVIVNVSTDEDWHEAGELTVSPSNGRVKFALMTAQLETDANYVAFSVRDTNANAFRLESCTIEHA